MARVVSQISPKTVLQNVKNGTRTKFWAAGIKIDKYAMDDIQNITTRYLSPQEVEVRISTRNWYSSDSIYSLTVILEDGRELSRSETNEMGLKFFDSEYLAEKYFLYASTNLHKNVKDVLKLHDMFYEKIKIKAPDFVEYIDAEHT